MKRKIIIFIIALISATAAYSQKAMEYYNLGLQAKKEYRYTEAIEYLKLAGNLWKKAGRKGNHSQILNNIGYLYDELGQYDKAIENYRKSLAIAKKLGDKEGIAINLSTIGGVYLSWGQYDKAIENYRKSLAIAKKLGDKEGIAINLNNIGVVYKEWGQYDKAIEYYREALAIAKELDKKSDFATYMNNIGVVYDSWGQYDKAIEYYRKALAIFEELGQQEYVARSLNNIGMVYYSWGQYDKAIENYRKALAIDEKLSRKGDIARDLNNIGQVYELWGQYDKAIEYYREALAIAEELGKKSGIATYMNNIGVVFSSWGQYDMAIEYYSKALAISEEIGEQASIAIDLNNIGYTYFVLKKYKEAEYNFNKSIAILEKLRLTAEGAVRRDYLASQIHIYQKLISTYISSNKPALAFNTKELSSAKYLIDQMGERLKEKDILFEGIEIYQKKLKNNTAIINYANINTRLGTAQIVVDKNKILAIERNADSLISKINAKFNNLISNSIENLRYKKNKEDSDFEKIINYYRILLSKRNTTKEEEEALTFIGKELYIFLLGNTEERLEGKDELIIILDGVLAYLPFETLIMPDGRYLIEKYHIKYTQSLTVSEIIAKRNYNQDQKPFLAFGGAVYDEISYETDIIQSEKQLEYLKKETFLVLTRGQSTRNAYSRLGFKEWDNLPGTLTEVQVLEQLIDDSEIYTGKSVSESTVKSLSDQGSLKDYKVIHFATHGLVVPEIPELSALVLSLSKEEENNEDGYLTMKEIVGLNINADFVNLSACETGLGKIYGGEGVVGLTQSFLVAGANSLSVSLWQVSDESTMKFMIGVYHLVQEKGLSYDRAITEMKRAFINGAVSTGNYNIQRGFKWIETDDESKKPNRYSSPYYWAPFVYYGN